jgi:hypothetical protein
MHITASVFINDDESGLHHDCDVWLEKLAPHEPVKQYRILKRQTQKEEEMDRFKRRNYSYQRFAQTCDLQLKDGLAKEISRSL